MGVFVAGVIDRVMRGELAAKLRVDIGLVCHQSAAAAHMLDDDRWDGFGSHVRDVERRNASVAPDKADNGLLRRRLAVRAVLAFAANVGFIDLDNLVRPAKSAVSGRINRGIG